jgi:recombination associated protein RdgC
MCDGEDGPIPDILSRTQDVLITHVNETKDIPERIIKSELALKVERLELLYQRKIKAQERGALKDEVMQSLVPRAFTTTRKTQLWIDIKNRLIIIDTSSAKVAEEALALLRKSLGSLPVVPVVTTESIVKTITEWVAGDQYPEGIRLSEKNDQANFDSEFENGSRVTFRKSEFTAFIAKHLVDSGNVITSIGLELSELVDLVIDEKGQLKKITYPASLVEQNNDIEEDGHARRYADFTLMCDVLRSAIERLYAAFGGMHKC